MLDFLSYPFVQRGMAAAVIVGGCCSLLGSFVVLRGMSIIGTGIAHGCLAGVALALLLGFNPLIGSLTAALVMIMVMEKLSHWTDLKLDATIGVVFSLAMALAVLFVGMNKRYTPDLMSYLFGNLLAVSGGELLVMALLAVVVGACLLLFYKEIQFASFDPEMAEASGIPAGLISLMLTILLGLTIVLSLRAVGELLVVALIVLPASAAFQVTRSLSRMIALAVALGVGASVFGLILAFFLDVPAGASIVILLAAVFFIVALPGRKRRV